MTTIDPTHSGMTFTRRPPRALLAGTLHKAIATSDDRAATVARLAVGLIILPHGLQHALGLLGGYGFSGTLGWMTGTLGFPAPLAALAIVTELLAPILLIAGRGRPPRRGRNRLHHGGRDHHARAGRVLHELVRQAAGRRRRGSSTTCW